MEALLTLPQTFGFLVAAILVTLAPGPDILMVLGLGMARGRKPGVAFGLGCALGCLNHTLLAAVGVSAIIAASPVAFGALKIAGGLYLVWLGIGALRSAQPLGTASRNPASDEPPDRLLVKGLVANAVNPKVILFFLAFLPQFVDNGRGGIGWQIGQLGLLFTLETIVIFGAIGWFAGAIGERLARRPTIGIWLDRVAGTVFVLLGLRLLVSR